MRKIRYIFLSVLVLGLSLLLFSNKVYADTGQYQEEYIPSFFYNETVNIRTRYITGTNQFSTLKKQRDIDILDFGIKKSHLKLLIDDMLNYYFSTSVRRPFLELTDQIGTRNLIFVDNVLDSDSQQGSFFETELNMILYNGENKEIITTKNYTEHKAHEGDRIVLKFGMQGYYALDSNPPTIVRIKYGYYIYRNSYLISQDLFYTEQMSATSKAQVLTRFENKHPSDNSTGVRVRADSDYWKGYNSGVSDYAYIRPNGEIVRADEYGNERESVGYEKGKADYGVLQPNGSTLTGSQWGTEQYNKGLSDGSNTGFKSVLSDIFGGIDTFFSIELIPGFSIGAIVLVPLVFGLLAFIIGRRK